MTVNTESLYLLKAFIVKERTAVDITLLLFFLIF